MSLTLTEIKPLLSLVREYKTPPKRIVAFLFVRILPLLSSKVTLYGELYANTLLDVTIVDLTSIFTFKLERIYSSSPINKTRV